MKKLGSVFRITLASLICFSAGCKERPPTVIIQLNWLQDPSFAGEYLLDKIGEEQVVFREGGPNSSPISDVITGRASVAVVGADQFLQALETERAAHSEEQVMCIFVDFQRSAVGWVLHPAAAERAGLHVDRLADPVKLNNWLFARLDDGTLRIADKVGTETTVVFDRWSRLHHLRSNVPVLAVGADTGIVLSAPMLAYPVYLNEEPFKLQQQIRRPMVIFDPKADQVNLYGNVVVTSTSYAQKNPALIKELQQKLRNNWNSIRTNPDLAVKTISTGYKGVTTDMLRLQLSKTLDFVFQDVSQPGTMDFSANGKWAATVESMQLAGVLRMPLSMDVIRDHCLEPK